MQSEETKQGGKWVKRLTVLVVAAVAVFGWFRWNQHPVTGTIALSSPANQAVKADSVEQPSHFKGVNLSFEYPAIYGSIQSNPASGRMVEQYSLNARISIAESRKIGITVNKTVGGDVMKEDSSYAFRAGDSTLYLHEIVIINDRKIEKFSKSDSAEVTYFIPGSGYYAIVAATSTRAGGEFTDDAAHLVTSLAWLR